ncbi:hypothetical protein TruAng_009541 [Truncatella angustata]|nr:hypothetical protein TruAng_009541 [Truncatella angustata]
MHHAHDHCLRRNNTNGVQHPPLEIKVPMALAEPDPPRVDGARARDHDGNLDSFPDQVRQGHLASHPLHPVQRRGIPRPAVPATKLALPPVADRGRVQEPEPPPDAVRGDEDALPAQQGAPAQLLEAVVGRDEQGGRGLVDGERGQPRRDLGRPGEVRDVLPEVVVEPRVRQRHLQQPRPHTRPHRALVVHDPGPRLRLRERRLGRYHDVEVLHSSRLLG